MEGLQLNIWAILVLVGAVQGIFLSVTIWRNYQSQPNRYLSLFLLVISLHLVEYTIAISQLSLRWPHTIASTYPLLFMMGPFYWLYTKSMLSHEFRLGYRNLLHFVPPLIIFLLFLPFYILSGQEKINFLETLVAEDGSIEVPGEQFLFMFAHVGQMFIYVILAVRNLKKIEVSLPTYQTSNRRQKQLIWLKKLSIGFLIYLGIYFLSLVILINIDYYQVEIDYVVVLCMALIMYLIGYIAMNNPVVVQDLGAFNKKRLKANVQQSDLENHKESLTRYFQERKPYLEENLKLEDVSRALNIPAYQISEVINEAFGKNFFEFTNQHRVEEAKKILENPDCQEMKIIAVAFDTGFGNKSTFNRVFKNATGITPSAYKLKHLSPQKV